MSARKQDPTEAIIADGLRAAGIEFQRGRELEPGRYSIDFYLPDHDLWIEVSQHHTPRKIEQLSRLPDVVLIQGNQAARGFIALISAGEGAV